ncbi:MAG: conjugal transfer protein TraF [Bdellovibrionales bacterium]|nr:conjugal transfer protein TraF [Bdellovibrionales bacterium]
MGIPSRLLKTIILLFPMALEAKELQYFKDKIDFWGRAESPKTGVESPTTNTDSGKFPWRTYLDPKNKEFFKEGDYTPPEPFMEIARDPSDENIKNWFEFQKKKNELSTRLQARMQEYLAKTEGPRLAVQLEPRTMATERKTEGKTAVDPSRFRIRMYFDSHCPHCKRMFGVLKRLQSEGFQVEALQVDSGPVPESEKIVPLGKADPIELKKHGASGVPFLLVADTQRKALLPKVEGYHDYNEMIELLRAASKN